MMQVLLQQGMKLTEGETLVRTKKKENLRETEIDGQRS